jgi:hypothetical protein
MYENWQSEGAGMNCKAVAQLLSVKRCGSKVPAMDLSLLSCICSVSDRFADEVTGAVAVEAAVAVVEVPPVVVLACLWLCPHAATRRAQPPLPSTSIHADIRRRPLYVRTVLTSAPICSQRSAEKFPVPQGDLPTAPARLMHCDRLSARGLLSV